MPLYGLVPDSPFIYAAQKGSRGLSFGGKGGAPSIRTTLEFKGLIIYKSVLNYELNTPSGMVGRHLVSKGRRIVAGAKRQAGRKTGALRASIHMEHMVAGNTQFLRIGSDVPHALLHHEGTRPHLITPHPPNKALVFRSGARVVRTSLVRHPGTRPNHYLTDQLRIHIR